MTYDLTLVFSYPQKTFKFKKDVVCFSDIDLNSFSTKKDILKLCKKEIQKRTFREDQKTRLKCFALLFPGKLEASEAEEKLIKEADDWIAKIYYELPYGRINCRMAIICKSIVA